MPPRLQFDESSSLICMVYGYKAGRFREEAEEATYLHSSVFFSFSLEGIFDVIKNMYDGKLWHVNKWREDRASPTTVGCKQGSP